MQMRRECKEASAARARTGFRPPETDQRRKVLMPSVAPNVASSVDWDMLITKMPTVKAA